MPENPAGIVVFAHGSGSSRHSPRNRHVADVLTEAGLGTLLFDLLTREEELDRANVFDISLLARRLTEVTGGFVPGLMLSVPISVSSAPARELRPRCGPRPNPAPASRPWCPAAGVLTLRVPG